MPVDVEEHRRPSPTPSPWSRDASSHTWPALRILRRDGRVDVRLPFWARVASVGQAGGELRRLLVEATARRSWPASPRPGPGPG